MMFKLATKILNLNPTAHTSSEQATRTFVRKGRRGELTLAADKTTFSNWRITLTGEESYVVIGWNYIQCS